MRMLADFQRHHRKLRWGAALLLAASLWAPAPASWAATDVGQAVVVVSAVRGTLGTQTRELVVKDNVYSQEVIETEPDSATRLVFRDGTELSIGPSSRVIIDRYIYDPNNKGAGELAMSLVSGVFEFASGDIPSSGYDLHTPFATIAVRGTRINVVVADDFLVNVKQGKVNVNKPDGTVEVGELFCFHQAGAVTGGGEGEVLGAAECAPLLARVLAMQALLRGELGRTPPRRVGFEDDQQHTNEENNLAGSQQ